MPPTNHLHMPTTGPSAGVRLTTRLSLLLLLSELLQALAQNPWVEGCPPPHPQQEFTYVFKLKGPEIRKEATNKKTDGTS